MEYQIGQCVLASNSFNCDEGKITEITQSTGTKKGALYKINNNYYFAEDIKKVFEVEDTPNNYYCAIKDIEEKMEDEIYNLVMKYAKINETKKYGIRYILTIPKKHLINVRSNSGILIKIKKIIISNPDKCQVRGHIFFEDVENIRYSYVMFRHQQFNIYSSLFRYIYK